MARLPSAAVPEGALVRLPWPPYDVLLTRVDGRLYAIEDACPHSGRSLCEGALAGRSVVCAGHGWAIDLVTGDVTTPAGRGRSNPRFEVHEGDAGIVVRG